MYGCHVLIKSTENYSLTQFELQFCNLSSEVVNLK